MAKNRKNAYVDDKDDKNDNITAIQSLTKSFRDRDICKQKASLTFILRA